MKPIGGILLAVLLGLSGLMSGCRQASDESEVDATPAEPVSVRATRAVETTLRPSIDLIGTVVPIPERTRRISAQTDAQIARIAVIEGQPVESGDLLIELDKRQAEARLAGAHAAVRRAEATLAALEHGPRAEELEAARHTARQLAASARSLEAKLDALGSMHEKGEIPDVEFDQAQARYEAAEAESQATAARLRLLEAGTRPEDVAAARAELAAALADEAGTKLTIEFCTIRSPISGIVTQLVARAGAYVTPADPLATVIDTSKLFVQAHIPSMQFAQVKPGAPADVWVSPRADEALAGRVDRFGAQADPETGDVDVLVSIQNDTGALVPGLACRVRVHLPELPNTLAIPVVAVADRDGTPVVTVIREEKAYEQPVSLGVSANDQVQVVSGLNAGDWVAVEGGYGLPAGCPVRVAPEPTGESIKPATGN